VWSLGRVGVIESRCAIVRGPWTFGGAGKNTDERNKEGKGNAYGYGWKLQYRLLSFPMATAMAEQKTTGCKATIGSTSSRNLGGFPPFPV
jgi:hypothetical protein